MDMATWLLFIWESASGRKVQGNGSMRIESPIRPRTIGLILAIIGVYLAVQSIFGEYIQATTLSTKLDSIPALIFDEFSVNAESTIPNWYSATILLIAAGLLALIAAAKYRTNAPYRGYWLALSIIFLYLSIDEGAAVHEIFSDPLHTALNTSGFLGFGWQLAAAPLLLIFGFLYLRFVFHLPPRTRNLVILSGVIYVGGAFFGDAVQANQLSLDGGDKLTLLYLAIGTVEELMEMMGIALFIYTLLSYMAETHYAYEFRLQGLPLMALQNPGEEAAAVPLANEMLESNRATTSGRAKRLALVMISIAVLFNVGVLYWGTIQPASSPSLDANTPLPVYQAIVSRYPTDQMAVTHVNGMLSQDNQNARQLAASMLNTFSQIMVISLPAEKSSVVVAGNTLPFDRDSLASLLRANGETQFVIYEGSAVKALIGNVQPASGK